MRAFVTELPLDEPARFNPARLEDLCDLVGETKAEDEVAGALDRIARGLGRLASEAGHPKPQAVRVEHQHLVEDADLIGMASLSRVARDVLACLAEGDPVAYAATLARLHRVGDRSIHAVWDFEDVSG